VEEHPTDQLWCVSSAGFEYESNFHFLVLAMATRLFGQFQSNVEVRDWFIKAIRGENLEPLVDFIILAEFDIDTGHLFPYFSDEM
jgi:hypothetical protein